MSEPQLTTLPNGLRIITDHVPGVESIALGIWAAVGTRHEIMEHNGAAHMTEHLLFKGTPTRNAVDIATEIENVGGNMNAYTSRELTSYHIHLLKDHTELAVDVLADMYQNATLPEEEIERERQVILQEIGMCHDTPDDLIFDHYYEAAYPEQTLGAPILGKPGIVADMQKDVIANHIHTHYTPAHTVISAAGGVDHDDFVKTVEAHFNSLPDSQDQDVQAANYQGGTHLDEKDLEQSHIILGFEGYKKTDENYYAVQALATLLGGGMSSRLFQEVREKRGLVYSVFSFHSGYIDSGQFAIYAGTGPDLVAELMPVLCEEICKLTQDRVSDEELNRTKAQMKSNLILDRESMMTRADRQAKYLISHDKIVDIQKIIQMIESISAADLQNVARHIFRNKVTLAGLGPLSQLEDYSDIQERLAA